MLVQILILLGVVKGLDQSSRYANEGLVMSEEETALSKVQDLIDKGLSKKKLVKKLISFDGDKKKKLKKLKKLRKRCAAKDDGDRRRAFPPISVNWGCFGLKWRGMCIKFKPSRNEGSQTEAREDELMTGDDALKEAVKEFKRSLRQGGRTDTASEQKGVAYVKLGGQKFKFRDMDQEDLEYALEISALEGELQKMELKELKQRKRDGQCEKKN